MKRHRYFGLGLWVIMLVALVAGVACRTTRRAENAPLSSAERAALLKRGKSPQVFGLTTYNSDRGAVIAGAFRMHKGHAARVDFRSDSATTTPVVGVNDNQWLMLLDSTASESWITVDALDGMKGLLLAQPDPIETQPRHVYDPVGGLAALVPKMTIDKMHIESSVFYMRNEYGPLGPLTRWEKSPFLDGVLGADFLRAFQFVRVSLRGRFVVFSATAPYPAASQAMATMSLVDEQGALAVEGRIDGEPKTILIDLAGDFELAMDRPEHPVARQISLGDVVFRQVEVESAVDLGLGVGGAPRIGRQLLERYDLVFNRKGSELLLERPSR